MSGEMMGKTSTAGGISQEQKALAQYDFGQGALGDMQAFAAGTAGQGGPGPSTMRAQALGGTQFKEAFDAATMSDKDYRAMVDFNNQQASALESIVGQAGQALGGAGGGGGGGGGGGLVG